MGCCLREHNGWCHDNYREGFVCQNNACGDDDCCVPNIVGTLAGAVVGVIGVVGVIIGVIIVVKVKQQQQRMRTMAPAGQGVPMGSWAPVHRNAAQPMPPQQMGTPTALPTATLAPAAVAAVPIATAVAVPIGSANMDPVSKLEQLKSMLDRGLITEAEYGAKKAEILATM